MSRWTHVAGIVRIDSIQHLFGANWVGDLEDKLNGPMPIGSGGGLRCKVVDAPTSEMSASRGYVTIDGDLRDFGELDEVDSLVDWLGRVFQPGIGNISFIIRQGIVQVEDEQEENSCHIWHDFDKGWQKLSMNIAD